MVEHDKSSKEYAHTLEDNADMMRVPDLDVKTKEQLLAELKAGFHAKWCELILDMIRYENRKEFESRLNTCRYALYIAEDFTSKEVLNKYDLMLKSLVWTIGVANRWIEF